jgi:hypothetical protein
MWRAYFNMKPVRPFDFERNGPGKLELLARCGYVIAPNFGGQAEAGGLNEIFAGCSEAPLGLRGDVCLFLCEHSPGAKRQAATDYQSMLHASSLHTIFIQPVLTKGCIDCSRRNLHIPPYFV